MAVRDGKKGGGRRPRRPQEPTPARAAEEAIDRAMVGAETAVDQADNILDMLGTLKAMLSKQAARDGVHIDPALEEEVDAEGARQGSSPLGDLARPWVLTMEVTRDSWKALGIYRASELRKSAPEDWHALGDQAFFEVETATGVLLQVLDGGRGGASVHGDEGGGHPWPG